MLMAYLVTLVDRLAVVGTQVAVVLALLGKDKTVVTVKQAHDMVAVAVAVQVLLVVMALQPLAVMAAMVLRTSLVVLLPITLVVVQLTYGRVLAEAPRPALLDLAAVVLVITLLVEPTEPQIQVAVAAQGVVLEVLVLSFFGMLTLSLRQLLRLEVQQLQLLVAIAFTGGLHQVQ
jgi:hypothetical protein